MSDVARGKRWARAAGVVAAVLAVVAAASLALRSAWPRYFAGPLDRAGRAYDRGDFDAAARLAREALKARRDDPGALRLLARSSARLGRDDAAIALYTGRISPAERRGEDLVLLGMALERRKQLGPAVAAWHEALDAGDVPPATLETLARLHLHRRRNEDAARVAERLVGAPGFEARAGMLLGSARTAINDIPGAAEAFRAALDHDPNEVDRSADPAGLRKLIARTFLRDGRPGEALALLRPVLDRGPDPEASWLLSRARLQLGQIDEARRALAGAGSYRADHPFDPEPGPYVGEARCKKCHEGIYKDSLANRHTRSFYQGAELKDLPRPDHPLPDPDDPKATHAFRERDGALWEQTRVGPEVYESLVEYAFGTSDRYLSFLMRDDQGRYRTARVAYYRTAEGAGWDRWALDHMRPSRSGDYRGELVGMRDGVPKCLYCHVTNARAGRQRVGPETADRGVGCERCHGPGAHHLAAVAARLPDLAITNPAAATPAAVTERQCNDCHILGRDLPQDVDEYLADVGWARSQSVGWMLSRCNTESGGSFGCVTCHDPHKGSRATTTAQYEARCLSCHAASPSPTLAARPEPSAASRPAFRACPVNPSHGCIGCHMPRVRLDELHTELTDHLVRARPGPAGKVAAAPAGRR